MPLVQRAIPVRGAQALPRARNPCDWHAQRVPSSASSEPYSGDGLIGFILQVIDALGEVGVGFLVMLESVIPPIPSEIILPAAGALVWFGELNGPLTFLCATVGSLAGALVLYWAGHAFGEERTRRWLTRVPLVTGNDIDRADAWFARRGRGAVFFGRLIPGVRSMISLPAGAAGMPLGTFCLYTTLGSSIWNLLLLSAGYYLGAQWQLVEEHVDAISTLIYLGIAVAVLVLIIRRVNERRRASASCWNGCTDRKFLRPSAICLRRAGGGP